MGTTAGGNECLGELKEKSFDNGLKVDDENHTITINPTFAILW
jgi:hypothetical protein